MTRRNLQKMVRVLAGLGISGASLLVVGPGNGCNPRLQLDLPEQGLASDVFFIPETSDESCEATPIQLP